MLETFKATIRRYWGLSYQDLTSLVRWLHLAGTPVTAGSFSNPSLEIVSVTNGHNQTVCHVPLETAYILPAFAVAPNVSLEEAQEAGNIVNAEIEHKAQMQGIKKVLWMLPSNFPPQPDEKSIRVIERQVARNDAMFDSGWPVREVATSYLN